MLRKAGGYAQVSAEGQAPTTSWLFSNIYTFAVVNHGALFPCLTW